MEDYLNQIKIQRILSWGKDFNEEKLSEMINRKIRQEKIAIKDVKLRTFITEDLDVTKWCSTFTILPMVRLNAMKIRWWLSTTALCVVLLLKKALCMLARLNPKKIIVVSSAPQIRYPGLLWD